MDTPIKKPFYLNPFFIAWAIVFIGSAVSLGVLFFLCNAALETMIFKGAMESFNALKTNLSLYTLISFGVLLIMANLVFWRTRQGFPIMLNYLLFGGFAYLDWFVLTQKYFDYRKNHELLFGEHNFGPLIGAALLVSGFLICLANLVLLWLTSREAHKKLNEATNPVSRTKASDDASNAD